LLEVQKSLTVTLLRKNSIDALKVAVSKFLSVSLADSQKLEIYARSKALVAAAASKFQSRVKP
jgi:hypothetical protein